jgi:hypothetical protein
MRFVKCAFARFISCGLCIESESLAERTLLNVIAQRDAEFSRYFLGMGILEGAHVSMARAYLAFPSLGFIDPYSLSKYSF